MDDREPDESCCGGDEKCIDRRDFIRVALGSAAALSLAGSGTPAGAQDAIKHFVPFDKGLSAEWLAGLVRRGEPAWIAGAALENVAMPVGGIGCGQLYLTGEGRFGCFEIFGHTPFSGYGATNYHRKPQPGPIANRLAVECEDEGGRRTLPLGREGFADLSFRGTYPIAEIRYRDPRSPVDVTLEAFSPFIPTNAADSSLPATILRLRFDNVSGRPVRVRGLFGVENPVLSRSRADLAIPRRTIRETRSGHTLHLHGADLPARRPLPRREDVVFADFESDDWSPWKAEGAAFAAGPVRGTLPGQQRVTGHSGERLVNSHVGGDDATGRLTSPEFTIDRDWINFLIGGGGHPSTTCLELEVEGRVVRSATGRNAERLTWRTFHVAEFDGRVAKLRVVDDRQGPWGHVNVDRIEFSDEPRIGSGRGLESLEDWGTFAVATSGTPEAGDVSADLAPEAGEVSADVAPDADGLFVTAPAFLDLAPGAHAEQVVIVAWHFPNHAHGRHYAGRFADARAVVDHVIGDLERLTRSTRAWRDEWYATTLPLWLLDRLHAPASTLATGTCEWWSDGRFWAWEGVGCCEGTCTHVWNYAQAPARLFPELERNMRERQDLGDALHEDGLVGFRGLRNGAYAADGQAGTILKCWREHLMSADRSFLERIWPKVKRVIFHALSRDGDGDGLIEGTQHNTYDIDFHGPNTFVGALYLAALAAGERMAGEMGEEDLATLLGTRRRRGAELTARTLWNGEYFIQRVDAEAYPKFQYGEGCLADHLFGQFWAHQTGLGHLYPRHMVATAIESVWRRNWAPDVAAQNAGFPPEREFAAPGEAGMFICTWPKSRRPHEGVRYRDEVWTGTEYQVAAGLIHEGFVTEGLAVVRAVDERYAAAKRNPFNEVECGDHYARAMASWGVYLALCGFEYHGPDGALGFGPRLDADDCRLAFTVAEGFGSWTQKRGASSFSGTLAMRHGRLRLTRLTTAARPAGPFASVSAQVGADPVPCVLEGDRDRVVLRFSPPLILEPAAALTVRLA